MSSSLQEPRVPSPEKTRGTVDDDDMADVRPDWSLQGFGELMVHVALFMLSGPTLILLQKYVLGILNFEYPIFIVTLAALAQVASHIDARAHRRLEARRARRHDVLAVDAGHAPRGHPRVHLARVGEHAALHLSVSFVQMLKAFQPVVLNVFIVGLGLEKFSYKLFVCIIVVTIGSIMAAIGEVNFTATGMSLMLISSSPRAPSTSSCTFT